MYTFFDLLLLELEVRLNCLLDEIFRMHKISEKNNNFEIRHFLSKPDFLIQQTWPKPDFLGFNRI